MTGRPIGLIGTAETENLGKKHPWRTTLGSGVTTVTSARATPRPHRVRRPRCVLPLERSHWHSSSRFSWRFPRPPGASALTRARRPPRTPTTPLTVFRGCARPLRQTRRRRPDAPRSPRRRHGRRLHRRRSRGRRLRRRQRHRADRTEGGETPGQHTRPVVVGRLVRLEGLVGILHVPVLHLVLVRPSPPLAPSVLHPAPSFRLVSLNPARLDARPGLLPQRLLELRIRLPQVRGREGPRVCERDDRRGRRGAREEGISRSRAPPARCARIHASRVVGTNGRGIVMRRVAGRRRRGTRGGALERRGEGRRVLLALGLRAGGLRGVCRGGWRRVLRPRLGAPRRVLMVHATREGTE